MQTRTALKRLSKGQIDVDHVSPSGPLAQNAKWLLKLHEQKTAELKASQHRHNVAASLPVLEAARQKMSEMIGGDVLPHDTPIVSRFDAYCVIKDASRQHNDDAGLRKFALHLERLWHKEPMGALTVGAITKLRDHYQYSSPRSMVGELTDQLIPKVSFKSLPVTKLARIASNIGNQEDYDLAIERNCLAGDDPISVRARTFIRELVNRAAKMEVSNVPDAETTGVRDTKDVGHAQTKKISGQDIATRIAGRLYRDAQSYQDNNPTTLKHKAEPNPGLDSKIKAEPDPDPDPGYKADPDPDPDPKKDPEKKLEEQMGIDGTGMLPVSAAMKLAETGEAIPKEAKAPPGWAGTVKKMKQKPDIEEPFALASWMSQKGFEPHYTEKGKKKEKFKATKTAEPESADFDPKVNPQQPDQVAVPECGCEALEKDQENKQLRPTMKAAIEASHPLVDDGADHFPMWTDELAAVSLKTAQSMTEVPGWWLGSINELKKLVEMALQDKEAGKLPPALEKFKFDKKDKKDEKKDKKARLDKDEIEKTVVAGREYRAAGYSIAIQNDDTVNIHTKTGTKQYPLMDLDGAIADFMYLVATTKHPAGSPPPPVFFIREGLRLTCPGCYETNSYEMPEEPMDLACGGCNALIPSKVVTAALNTNAASEEVTLVTVIPTDLQVSFGEKFAEAANMLGADSVGTDGCRAEAYAINVPASKLAEIWDFMVEAGFQPIAQMEPDIDMPPDTLHEEFEMSKQASFLDDITPIVDRYTDLDAIDLLEMHPQGIAFTGSTAADAVSDCVQEISEVAKSYGIPEHPPYDSPFGVIFSFGTTSKMAAEESGEIAIADQISDIADELKDASEDLRSMEHHAQAMTPPPTAPAGSTPPPIVAEPMDSPEMSPGGGAQWADWQVIQAAMMHYQHQGMNPVEAIVQFRKDYASERKDKEGNVVGGHEYDPNVVVQVAAAVWKIDAGGLGEQMALTPESELPSKGQGPMPTPEPAIPAAPKPGMKVPGLELATASKKKADLPATKVNQQQPDAVKPENPGPDTEQTSEIPDAGKIQTQHKPEGKLSDSGTEPDTDNRDPGDYGAEAPKAQHPVTDQAGTSLPATDLGTDSDTGETTVTKKMDQVSKAAPKALRSAKKSKS